MQLANTPLLQSTAPGLHPVSIHQTSPLVRGSKHLITAYYSIYRPRKDERLSRPAWLVTYWNKVPPPGVEPGHVTHPSTNRARRRVTSLIRPTLLPLRHAAVNMYVNMTTSSKTKGRLTRPRPRYNSRLNLRKNFTCLPSSITQRAGSSMRLVRMKLQGPGPDRGSDRSVQRKFTK